MNVFDVQVHDDTHGIRDYFVKVSYCIVTDARLKSFNNKIVSRGWKPGCLQLLVNFFHAV